MTDAERYLAQQRARDIASGPGFMTAALGHAAGALIDAGQEVTLPALLAWMRQKGEPYASAAQEAERRWQLASAARS